MFETVLGRLQALAQAEGFDPHKMHQQHRRKKHQKGHRVKQHAAFPLSYSSQAIWVRSKVRQSMSI